MGDVTENAANKAIIQAAASILMDAALRAIEHDPHQWSDRPCQTCKAVSAIAGRKFGCYLYAAVRGERAS